MTEPFAAWIERDVLHVAGPDAVEYLQGQLSQDVGALASGQSTWTLLLEPTGKVISWLRATRVGDTEIVLDGDPGSGDPSLARLKRFLLRTKAELDLVATTPTLAVRGVAMPNPGAGLPIAWPDTDGYDQLGSSATVPDGIALVGGERYELARIEAGVPAFGRELTGATIPAEAGQWLIDASVSFTKGCYAGQELVARIDSRGGNVPRPVRKLVVDASDVEPGAEVHSGDATVGRVTSAAWSDERGAVVALGPIARSVERGAAVTVAGSAAHLA
jgi:folate-binding protein YgfZ